MVLVYLCTPDDVITLVLPLSSAVDNWLYFNYLRNEGGHGVPLECILLHASKVLERLYKWLTSTAVHEHCTEHKKKI